MFVLVAALAFLSIALVGYAVAARLRQRDDTDRALATRLTALTGARGGASGRVSVLKDRRLSSIAFLNALLGRISLVRPVVRLIRQAGLKKRAGEVLLYVPLLTGSAIVVNILAGGNLASGLVASALAGATPLLVVQRMRRTRARLFSEQLPDALDLVQAALHAGHGIIAAFSLISDEFPDPIAQEFREVAEEVRLGLPLRDALHNLVDRIDDPDLPILVVGVLVADESGGNLAEVLENISHTMRERFKLLRDMRVLTAQGRLSGMVLTALPFIVGTVMYLFNPKYFAPMVQTSTGHYLLLSAFVSLLCGHFVIRRIVQIRV